jgi:hypothetical protein
MVLTVCELQLSSEKRKSRDLRGESPVNNNQPDERAEARTSPVSTEARLIALMPEKPSVTERKERRKGGSGGQSDSPVREAVGAVLTYQ